MYGYTCLDKIFIRQLSFIPAPHPVLLILKFLHVMMYSPYCELPLLRIPFDITYGLKDITGATSTLTNGVTNQAAAEQQADPCSHWMLRRKRSPSMC